jgi:sucrose-6-phosphate hydrolase SacC (GH32 family)
MYFLLASTLGFDLDVRFETYCPPVCGPGHEECGPAFGPTTPQFHVRDNSCGMNDPNGPFWDARHGYYHMFYQAHKGPKCNPAVPPCDIWSEVWGHAVSKDLASW